MKYRYSKRVADLLDGFDLPSLVSQLSDLLLASGFRHLCDPQSEDDQTFQALHDAIIDALLNGGVLSDEMLEQLSAQQAQQAGAAGSDTEDARDLLEALIQRLIEQLTEHGYVTMGGPPGRQRMRGPGETGAPGATRFHVTDKAIDFLGYRALRDLLGSMGRSSAGRHDTRHLAPGVEAGSAPRPYEFGDTLTIDASSTILNAIRRRSDPADIDYEDLMVAQGDYQSSCATVLMLDCSHSMVLYGEDRFTPREARRAGALEPDPAIKHPGDALKVVLFTTGREEAAAQLRLGRVFASGRTTRTRARACGSPAECSNASGRT